MPQHTEFAPTPTGHLHVAHFWIAGLNKRLTRGGTYLVRHDTLPAYVTSWQWREPVGEEAPGDLRPAAEYYAEENSRDLHAWGLGASTAEILKLFGLNGLGTSHLMGDLPLVDFIWETLGDKAIFGDWPPPMGEGNTPSRSPMWLNSGCPHPYIVLERVIQHMSTRRTMTIDGADLRIDEPLYEYFARKVQHYRPDWQIAQRVFVPRVARSKGCELCTSDPETTDGMRLRELPCDTVNPDNLWAYMEKVCLSPTGAVNFNRPDERYDCIDYVLAELNPKPVIDEDDWARFVKTGEVS